MLKKYMGVGWDFECPLIKRLEAGLFTDAAVVFAAKVHYIFTPNFFFFFWFCFAI